MKRTLTLKEFVDISNFDKISVRVLGEEKFVASATDIWFNGENKYNEYLNRDIVNVMEMKNGIIINVTQF